MLEILRGRLQAGIYENCDIGSAFGSVHESVQRSIPPEKHPPTERSRALDKCKESTSEDGRLGRSYDTLTQTNMESGKDLLVEYVRILYVYIYIYLRKFPKWRVRAQVVMGRVTIFVWDL